MPTFVLMTAPADRLLRRDDDKHRPSIENRVAYQWEPGLDTLGYRNATLKDRTALTWLREALETAPAPRASLDVGCGFGNHVLMLNALAGKPHDVEFVGVDLFEPSLEWANEFAERVPGFSNCRFFGADIEKGLPFPDSHFDVLNIADVLEHLTDPPAAMRELTRVVKPGGTIVFNTPLRTSIFKSVATVISRLSMGRIKKAYYSGKDTEVVDGKAVMEVHAGHDHISEMNYRELMDLVEQANCTVTDTWFMPVMSGSAWFDKHPFLLASLMFVEAIHEKLQRPSWAHGVMLRLRVDK